MALSTHSGSPIIGGQGGLLGFLHSLLCLFQTVTRQKPWISNPGATQKVYSAGMGYQLIGESLAGFDPPALRGFDP